MRFISISTGRERERFGKKERNKKHSETYSNTSLILIPRNSPGEGGRGGRGDPCPVLSYSILSDLSDLSLSLSLSY